MRNPGRRSAACRVRQTGLGNVLDRSVRGDSANWGLTVNRDGIAVMVFQFERQSGAEARRRNSGNGGHFVENIGLHLSHSLRLSYLSFGNKQPDGLNLLGVSKARLYGAQRDEATNQQPCPD